MSRRGDIITSRFFPKVRPGWLAPPALRLALRYICMKTHSLCSLPTWWHPCLRIELRGPAAKVSWVIFCSGRLLGCLEIQNGHEQLEMERTTTRSLVPFQPFQPGRNKLRHALTQPRVSLITFFPPWNGDIVGTYRLTGLRIRSYVPT